MSFLFLIAAILTSGSHSYGYEYSVHGPAPKAALVKPYHKPAISEVKLQAMAPQFCDRRLSELPGRFDKKALKAACDKVVVLDSCQSENGKPIFYYQHNGTDPHGKRILAISLIHGDEHPAGTVGRNWMLRLARINPRNTWRVIPVVNPDGMKAWTRFNVHGVDLNRNFPSTDWNKLALSYWHKREKSSNRRYPGPSAASERETQCIIKQITNFKPDFIVSVHTPYGVLDFDGPTMGKPKFTNLPWYDLGTFPGSLGRYMWVDHKVPVLTVELHIKGLSNLSQMNALQDISGTMAIESSRMLKKRKMDAKVAFKN